MEIKICSKCKLPIEDDKWFFYNLQPTHFNCSTEKKIDYQALLIGSKIKVETQNSIYILEKIDGSNFNTLVSGGYFEKKYNKSMKVKINGCTWGGSMLKVDAIEVNMCLEMIKKEDLRRVTTTFIKNIEVLSNGDKKAG